jgi:hypothetical protein
MIPFAKLAFTRKPLRVVFDRMRGTSAENRSN